MGPCFPSGPWMQRVWPFWPQLLQTPWKEGRTETTTERNFRTSVWSIQNYRLMYTWLTSVNFRHQDSWAYNWINTESSFHRALFPHCKHDWAKEGHANDLVRLFSPTRKYCFLVEWLMPLNTSCSYFISVCLIKTCNCVKRSRSHQSFVHFLITYYFLCWLHSSCPNTSFCSL